MSATAPTVTYSAHVGGGQDFWLLYPHSDSNHLFEEAVHAVDDADVPANMVCLLGGTLSNFRSPAQVLQTINSSLGLHDLLIYTGYLDTPKVRRYFDFISTPDQKLTPRHKIILDFLNIEESLYDVEQLFSPKRRARTISIRPRVDLSVMFELNGRRCVELRKDEPILLWRHRHYSALEFITLFDVHGFDLLQAAKSKDQEYILMISKIKTDN